MLLQAPKTHVSAPNPSTNGLAMDSGHHHILKSPSNPLSQDLSFSSPTQGGGFDSLEQPKSQPQPQQLVHNTVPTPSV
jgi:hypothetical protein